MFFFDKIGIDDAVGAISVHGVNGAWGCLSLGLFADGTTARVGTAPLVKLADGAYQMWIHAAPTVP